MTELILTVTVTLFKDEHEFMLFLRFFFTLNNIIKSLKKVEMRRSHLSKT